MSYVVNEHEFQNVISLSAFDRYQYFLNKVADWEEVWSVRSADGFRMMSDPQGVLCIPVWPAEPYAQACCQEEWADASPVAVSLEDWMAKWLPGIKNDNRKIALFPLPQDQGMVLDSDQLRQDLQELLDEFE